MGDEDLDEVVGHADGYRRGYVEDWAWRPKRPHDKVEIELLVDGAIAGTGVACMPRPDLITAGIGRGEHAFVIPLAIGGEAGRTLHLTVRVRNGPVLPDGELDLAVSADAQAELVHEQSIGHLEAVFGPLAGAAAPPPRRPQTSSAPTLHFVLYAARGRNVSAALLGMSEYSYVMVMQGFRQLLRRLAVVHVVDHPGDADQIYAQCMERGESCLLLAFTPPQSTPLGLRCPVVPVIAWEFGNIPTGGWGNAREDWRLVLRQTGRAITLSEFAARAIRATMGATYPVIAVPTPVADRVAGPNMPEGTPGGPCVIGVEGFV